MTPNGAEAVGNEAQADQRAVDVTIRPDAPRWRGLVSRTTSDAATKLFRRELGLPDDRRVIMSGHQSQVWHPGILAKLMAMDAAAAKLEAAAAWVVVDHDDNDPLTIRAPFIGTDGRLTAARFTPPGQPSDGVPACRQPAWSPSEDWRLPGRAGAAPGVERGIEQIRAAYLKHAGSGSAANQAALAAMGLASPLIKAPPIMINASTLAATRLFAELVAQIKSDPRACIEAHNKAVAAFPRDRIAPLELGGDRLELPLWRIGASLGTPRMKVFAADLASLPFQTLAPRALLLTGLMRLSGCELFIHGLGGERYDRITELWLGKWLGKSLTPTTMVTATLRLRIPGSWPTEEDINRAAWTAHRSRHDPLLLGDAARAEAKQSLLNRINAAPRKSRDRDELYRELHALLDQSRREHQPAIETLDTQAAAMRARADEAMIATDRTWAFPLYQADQLASLREAIDREFE